MPITIEIDDLIQIMRKSCGPEVLIAISKGKYTFTEIFEFITNNFTTSTYSVVHTRVKEFGQMGLVELRRIINRGRREEYTYHPTAKLLKIADLFTIFFNLSNATSHLSSVMYDQEEKTLKMNLSNINALNNSQKKLKLQQSLIYILEDEIIVRIKKEVPVKKS